jgi:hypothetical protein
VDEATRGFKYLAIKNWHRYQGGRMKNGDERRPWVKSYVDREADPDFLKLTGLHRYILDGICRLRGRLGTNLPNDPAYVSRALGLIPAERSQTPRAVLTLISRGFLILTNQQHVTPEESREEESREEGEQPRKTPPENGVAASSPDGSKPDQNRPLGDVLAMDVPEPPETNQAPTGAQESRNGHSTPPVDLTVQQLARGMMETLGIAGGQSDLAIWSQAITLKARRSGMSISQAYEFILERAEAAQLSGQFSKPTFWMKDAAYDHKPTRSTVKNEKFRERIRDEFASLDRQRSRASGA